MTAGNRWIPKPIFALFLALAGSLAYGDEPPRRADVKENTPPEVRPVPQKDPGKQTTATLPIDTLPAAEEPGESLATEQKPADEQPGQTKELVVPDLRELIAKPQNEMRAVVQRYDADRSSLTRTYTIALSPTRHARLTKFHTDWLAALKAIDAAKLSDEARTELSRLQETIQRHQGDLDSQAKAQAELVPLIPFAQVIVNLEESRRRIERMDSPKTAGVLTDLKNQIDQARKTLDAGIGPSTQTLAARAADAVNGLKTNLSNWHRFYDGYDPLFTWWMGEPYKEVDKALQDYSAALRALAKAKDGEEQKDTSGRAGGVRPLIAAAHQGANTPRSPQESDVPDLRELMALPQSELRTIFQRYQTDRGNLSRFVALGLPVEAPRSPERIARMKKFYTDWLAGLEKLDFDRLSADGRVDYVLIRHGSERELRSLESQAKAGDAGQTPRTGRGGQGGGRGGGKPISRDGLIAALEDEMIPYTPEELIVIAEQEFAWCEAEYKRAARELGLGDDWRQAVELAKTMHVEPGRQPEMIRDLAWEAINYLRKHDLVTVPQIAAETWGMQMMSPQRQLVNPFFTGGASISVSFPTNTMSHEAKLQSMRGNNIPFSRATVHHELIPGHNLQGFMQSRYRSYRRSNTPFWGEGWALYWEMLLYTRGFPRTPEDRVGFLFWRSHRCARIVFSLNYHLDKWTQQQCIDYLVERVGHERDNATAEVRRSFAGGYSPLYQAAYMLGGLQIRELRKEFVESGKMTNRAFHDTILQNGSMPIAMVRAVLVGDKLTRNYSFDWKFYGTINTGQQQTGDGK